MKKTFLVLGVLMMGAANQSWSASGVSLLKGTDEKSPISGKIDLTDTPQGLKVTAKLQGVPAGQHGFHIHEFGLCDDSGKAAGGHYNPMAAPHGHLMKDGAKKAHLGDLGNIEAKADGTATMEAVIPGVSLSGGQYTVGGRAIILHEKVDDFGQPVGNAGGRIGCAPILIVAQ